MKEKFNLSFWVILFLCGMCVFQTWMHRIDIYNMILLYAFCGWSLFVVYRNPIRNGIRFSLNYEKLQNFKNIIIAFVTLIFNGIGIYCIPNFVAPAFIGVINGFALMHGIFFPFFTRE